MKGSKPIILVVILAVAGVVIAKQKMKAPPAVTEQAAQARDAAGQTAPGATDRLGDDDSQQPRVSSSRRQDRPTPQAPAVPPTATSSGNSPEAVAPLPPPPRSPVETRPADDKKSDGPLPGSELAESLASRRPTMADFGRTWCKPCKAMVPILKQAALDYRGKANIVFVDLGKYAKLGREYRIRAMPTQIFFDAQGREVGRHMGYMGSNDIERRLGELGAHK